ncbi:Gfo/Idh/MocA family oxidoreductase [Candidatus Bathyarchaeota archaeon]|nr:Gfo/Idh/MocA family oxidoreductase [Candidatus Bathyarchaeota archaeon]
MSIRIGIVGCGSISWEHVRRLSLLRGGEAKIVALCDAVKSNAENLRRYVNIFRNIAPEPLDQNAVFESYDDMLDKVELDAVIICTPHNLHYEHTMKAFKRGLHVLVEKPMAISVGEAEEMVEESSKRNLVLTVGYQRHCQPEYVYARRKILSGELGEPHMVVGWLVQNLVAAGRFYLDPKVSGGGQIKASGTHLIDAILWMTDTEPVKVKAFMDRAGAPVELYAVLAVELSNGALASISISGGHPRPHTDVTEEVRVWCSKGAIHIAGGAVYVEDSESNIIKIDRNTLPRVSPNPDVNFVRTILGEEENLIPGICGLKTTKLEEMAYLDVGQPIPSRLRRA